MKWQPYPGYKPSGVEWLGEIPEKWEMKPLKRTFITLNGSTPKSGEPNYWDGDIPWATPDDLGSLIGDTLNITRRMITQEGYESCGTSLAPAGSLVLSTRAPIGHLAIAGVPMCANQGCRCLVFRGKVESRFYYYQLLTAKQELESWGQGSTFKELGRDRLTAVYLVSPPFNEQRAIAAFLDRETARIDALMEKKRRQIELLQEKRTALISHAVTKGLDPTAPMKESGIEWLGKIPAHWQVLPIKRVAHMDSGHTPDKKVEEYWTDCTIPWVSLNDTAYLKDNDYIDDTAFHVNELGLANSSAHLLPARIVLFTRDATIGLSAITTRPMAVSQHIIAWICGPRMVPEYLLRVFYAQTQELERLCMGSTIRTLGMPDVLELITPLPPVEEQHLIVKRLEDEVPKLVALVGKVEESIRILLEHRTALISAAVTGEIDVREAGT